MMRWLFTVALYLSAPLCYAEIYKCVNEGKTVFSQTPCAPNAVLVNPTLYQPSAQSVRDQQQTQQSLEAMSKGIDRDYGLLVLQRRIADADETIARLLHERDQRIAALRLELAQARQDKAGAASRKTLSSEISNLRDQYKTSIELARADQRRAEKEYSRLQRGH